jgi:hypothetical protein
MVSEVWWRLRGWWRGMLGLGGDFTHGEISARASDLTTRWHASWPAQPPLLPGVSWDPSAHDDRWVRFHSLPDSKQWPESSDERFELLHRHFTALRDLVEEFGDGELIVILKDWDASDMFGGWTKTHVPGSWPWVSWRDPDDDDDTPYTYYWIAPLASINDLGDLLLLVADEIGKAMITDHRMSWLYIPYPGGADVFLPSTLARDELRDRHPDWRPKTGRGA